MGNMLCFTVDRREEVSTSGEGAEMGRETSIVSSSPYSSSRIQSMLESRSKFKNETEFAIESSKVHWSELDLPSDLGSPESDRIYFDEVLKKHPKWGVHVFRDFDDLEIGGKLAEGGQGEIYHVRRGSDYGYDSVVKVFKEGYCLRSLLQAMPPSLLSAMNSYSTGAPIDHLRGITILKDERFQNRLAIVMEEQSCDLRKLIDDQMLRKSNQGPPFTISLATKLMYKIATDMVWLHYGFGIIHKDLKAANVLVRDNPYYMLYEDVTFGTNPVAVADFECSMVGVMGTQFWRAPEILRQLKNQIRPVKFSRKCDVYSFGMLCYELVTGRIPFEGHALIDYDIVLRGRRPALPRDLDPSIKEIITQCWHQKPSMRPNFRILAKRLRVLLSQRESEKWVNAEYGNPETYCKLNNIEYPQ